MRFVVEIPDRDWKRAFGKDYSGDSAKVIVDALRAYFVGGELVCKVCDISSKFRVGQRVYNNHLEEGKVEEVNVYAVPETEYVTTIGIHKESNLRAEPESKHLGWCLEDAKVRVRQSNYHLKRLEELAKRREVR